jgi:hypothetical protein
VIAEVDVDKKQSIFKGVLNAIDNFSAQARVGIRALKHALLQPFWVELR